MKGPVRPWCANCGPLSVDGRGRITAHHCLLSNAPDSAFWRQARPVRVNPPVRIRSLLGACMGHPLTAAGGILLLALLWVMGWL